MRIVLKKSMQMRIIRNLFFEQNLVIRRSACHDLRISGTVILWKLTR